MEVAGPVITSVTESSLVVIKKHLDLFVSSSKYVRDMHARMTELNGAAHDMRTRQVLNEENSQVVPHCVPGWLAEVDKIKARAERIPTDGVGCCNINAKYKAGKQSCDILEEIDRLMKEKAEMVWTDQRVPLGMVRSPRPSTSNAVHEDEQNQNKNIIKSRELIFNDALKSLEPNNVKTQKVALCGMAGVGKTTMMEDLVKVARDKNMFKYIVKVSVGQNPNILVVQKVVAEYLGEALTETSKQTRADRLLRRFENILRDGEKKILVTLDDVWDDMFELKYIGLTSPLPKNIKLLLTSREGDVCTQMGVETSSIFKIDVLKDGEEKDLFWDTARLGSNSDVDPEIGEDIIKRCGGLPLALTTIAFTLRDKEKEEWKNALSRLQNKKFNDHKINEIFEISYENLKDEDVKSIFLLCGLFPEDSNIVKEDILRYGWGLKFFQDEPTVAEARTRVNTCVKKLIRSNLLIESDREGSVKMHDLVRDFVLSSVSKVRQASIVNHNNDVSEKLKEEESYERILINCGGRIDFLEDFSHPSLTFLKLMDGDEPLKFPEHLYTRMEKLEVVAYENMNLSLLPQYSINLRALCLLSCSLTDVDISFLGDLINLEVLSLVNCRINKLPSKIGNLRRLKLLDLTKSRNLCIADGVFQNLKKLEELYMGVYKKDTDRFTDANCDELKILSRKLSALELEFFQNKAQPVDVSFERLERFRISVGCLLDDKYSFKNTLKLVTSSSELLECKINELFRKTEILHLEINDMSYLENILMHPPQSSFGNLKELNIFGCAGLTYLFTISVTKVLTKLESLKIRSCPILKSVVNGGNSEAMVITFHKLKILSLKNLPELISLSEPVNVINFPQLTKLELDDLPNITSIFPQNHINISAEQPFLNKDQVVIPKLEKLQIRFMNNLMEIWPCEITSNKEEVNNISSLREIEVRFCDNLVNLFPSNPMQLLIHLEVLEVTKCDSIEVLFNIDFGKFKQHNCNNILRIIKVWGCHSFREVWRIKDAKNNFSYCGFLAVEDISIGACKRFRNIVTPTTVNFDMRALKYISIQMCGEYGEQNNEFINNSRQINALSKEEISIEFPSYQITHNFHQLRHIYVEELEGVEVVFEIKSSSNNRDQLVTTQQQQPPLLPYLEYLNLSNLDALSHVWKCSNWNEFFIHHKHQPQSSFQNLTFIHLRCCNSIKYLFSPLMVKLLCNLKKVTISICDSMEEIVSTKYDEDEGLMTTCISTHTTTTLFPHLQSLELYYMDNLKRIGGGGVTKGTTNSGQSKFSQVDIDSWSLCQYAKEIDIDECFALSSLIPSYAAGHTQKLQVLSIRDCRSMVEVFETKEINNDNASGCGTTSILIPRPRISTIHKFPNLKILTIVDCERLESIFTFSTLKSLKELEKLTVENCKAMKVIVRDEYEEQTTKDVVFPHLKSIELTSLPILEGFLLGMNIEFHWPLLDYVLIDDCPQMMAFTSGCSTTPRLKYIHTELGKHNLERGLNFNMTPRLHQTPSPSSDSRNSRPTISEGRPLFYHNLMEIKLTSKSQLKIIIPSSQLQQLQRLETIHADDCDDLEEVFEVALEPTNNESQTVVKIPKLREMDLENLNRIKYIWKSNQSKILEFPNLTRLSIDKCLSLEYVFTCSMAASLIQLQEVHIQRCDNMKVVIKQEEEDCDAKSKEIKLPCLRSLKLNLLSSLEGFCLGKHDFALPSLDTVEITKCPRITFFTRGRSVTPELTLVETDSGSFDLAEDINTFIVTKIQQGVSFGEIL